MGLRIVLGHAFAGPTYLHSAPIYLRRVIDQDRGMQFRSSQRVRLLFLACSFRALVLRLLNSESF